MRSLPISVIRWLLLSILCLFGCQAFAQYDSDFGSVERGNLVKHEFKIPMENWYRLMLEDGYDPRFDWTGELGIRQADSICFVPLSLSPSDIRYKIFIRKSNGSEVQYTKLPQWIKVKKEDTLHIQIELYASRIGDHILTLSFSGNGGSVRSNFNISCTVRAKVIDQTKVQASLSRVEMRDPITMDIHLFEQVDGDRSKLFTRVKGTIDGHPVNVKTRYEFTGNPNNEGLCQNPIWINLRGLNIPRFKKDAKFDLAVEYIKDNRILQRVPIKGVIPMPTIFVGGIEPSTMALMLKIAGFNAGISDMVSMPLGGAGTFPTFETEHVESNQAQCNFANSFIQQQLTSTGVNGDFNRGRWFRPSGYGTRLKPFYPTMHTLDFYGTRYDRNSAPIDYAAELLFSQINALLKHTFHDRVNLVGHSKGAVTIRALLSHPRLKISASKMVRSAVMIQGPHTGAVLVTQSKFVDAMRDMYKKNVFMELIPNFKYYETGKWPKGEYMTKLGDRTLAVGYGTKYFCYYGSSKLGTPERIRKNGLFVRVPGDLIVPELSQRGMVGTGSSARRIYSFAFAERKGSFIERNIGKHVVLDQSVFHVTSMSSGYLAKQVFKDFQWLL